jgi:S-DNA-T family DNA segregation ATPase FtsK/SpoIIIE
VSKLFKKFKHDIIGILFIGASLFLALSLASFNPKDPSLNSVGFNLKATNLCGVVGSFLSDIMYQFFGLTAWVFVAGLMRLSYMSFKGEEFKWRTLRLLWSFILVMSFSSLMAIYFPKTKIFGDLIFVGGLLGLGVSQVLIKAFNYVGVQIVLWSVTGILLVFYSEKSVEEMTAAPRNVWTWFMGWIKEQAKERKKMLAAEKAEEKEKAKAAKEAAKLEKVAAKEQKTSLFTLNKKLEEKEQAEEKADEEDSIDNIVASKKPEQLDMVGPYPDTDDPEDDEDTEKGIAWAPRRKVIMKIKPPKRIENWEMPKLSLLEDPPATRVKIDKDEIRRKAELLTDKLKHFSVEGEIVDCKPGPLVTLFEFKPNADVKLSKITELQDDLSLALSSESLRVIAPIPGRDVVGIETSNSKRETVFYKDLVAEDDFWKDEVKLPIALGRQVNGDPKIVDLRKMPHLMVAGTTGSGKSVFITSIITGLLFRHSPKTLRLILVDPKQVDLAAFQKVPHLVMPPITEPRKAVLSLKWAIREMDKRYKSMSKFGARGLESFNEMVSNLSKEKIEEHEKANLDLEANQATKTETYYFTPQPYIVIVVEEFGDLMAVDKQNVEQSVVRLAQMARACGIHLILAMQSPRKEVVTGLIKTNIPGRIGLKVASKMDSRIILDEGGAERMLPNGDMLFLAPGVSKPMRHHGPFLSEKEINGVAEFWANQGEPEFDILAMRALEGHSGSGDSAGEYGGGGGGMDFSDEQDEMYNQILHWASEQKHISASLIQRRFRLGYPRAARLIEIFEKEGVVGPANGSKPRQVLINQIGGP